MTQRLTIDTTPPVVREGHVLKRAEWVWRTVQGDKQGADVDSVEGDQLQGPTVIPNTWSEPPKALRDRGFLALVGCPKCGKANALHSDVHKVSHKHKVTPSYQCPGGCGFHRSLYLDRWQQKPLYAAACERYDRQGRPLQAWIEYCHGRTAEEARVELGLDAGVIVKAVGLAIGFEAADRDAKVILAT